jgi:hypothetical protein
VDIDECATNNGGCDPLKNCTNEPGSFTCSDCPEFYYDSSGVCLDINECQLGTGGCSENAFCKNRLLGNDCICKDGFTGNGLVCVDFDECQVDNGGCSLAASCINTVGSFYCGDCFDGYTGDGITCTPTSLLGSISGRVVDAYTNQYPEGQDTINVYLHQTNLAITTTDFERSAYDVVAVSPDTGLFEFTDLSPGVYTISSWGSPAFGVDDSNYYIFFTSVVVYDDGSTSETPAIALLARRDSGVAVVLSWSASGDPDLDLAANFVASNKRCQVGFYNPECGNGALASRTDAGGAFGVEVITVSPLTKAAYLFAANTFSGEDIAASIPTMYLYIPDSRAPVSVTTSTPATSDARQQQPYWLGFCIDGDLNSIVVLNEFRSTMPQPRRRCWNY